MLSYRGIDAHPVKTIHEPEMSWLVRVILWIVLVQARKY